MINIAEILKDCPKGIQLYSPICGDCTFEKIHLNTSIVVCAQNYTTLTFNVYGQYFKDIDNAECLLFPSKENRDWNTFQRPFKDGDILTYTGNYTTTFIYRNKDNEPHLTTSFYVGCNNSPSHNFLIYNKYTLIALNENCDVRLATEDEKRKLFNIIKENGYKWNAETKTLEKLIIPKFKVGDEIVKKDDPTKSWYVQGIDTYCNSDYYYIVTKGQVSNLHFKDQDEWELLVITPKFKIGDIITNGKVTIKISHIDGDYYYDITRNIANRLFIKFQDEWKLVPNKFDISTLKAFDKVLVRNDNSHVWKCNLYSHYSEYPYHYVCADTGYKQCIPYEGNQHLLGTCDDCDEYYKNWK